jgi:diguanylate cyclase (GGDEF)-like protein/PAS domain S-box-containing protein
MRVWAFIALVGAAAALLVAHDLATLNSWPSESQLGTLVVLLLLLGAAGRFEFQLRTGWRTNATTVPHIAATLLLPPGLAAIVGFMARAMNPRPFVLRKFAFNTANTTLSVAAAAHVASAILSSANLVDFSGLIATFAATLVYHTIQVTLVATVFALDQRKPILPAARQVFSPEQFMEVGLGVLGGTVAVLIQVAPLWAVTLAVPGALILWGKKEMDRARRRSRDLALTSAVGRAVAGTLRPDVAFEAITSAEVLEALKLDGMALQPAEAAGASAFEAHVVCELDRPDLRRRVARRAVGARRTVREESATFACLAVPFGSRDGAPVGALVAWRMEHGHFSAEERLVLETLADHAAVALETHRLSREAAHAEGQRQADVIQREALRQSEERFRSLVQNASDVITILRRDGSIGYASPAAERVWGRSTDDLLGKRVFELVHPEQVDSAHTLFADVLNRPGVNMGLELSLWHTQGSWRQFEVVATNLLDVPAVEGIVVTYHDITQQNSLQQELRHMAFRDSLTGLPNRALFVDRLQQGLIRADRQLQHVAVLFLDLDRFKVVNDSLGHHAGDALLVEIATRLRACLRETDTAARLGGDEFTVLLDGIGSADDAIEIADRIHAALLAPIVIDSRELFISASIGIAISTPRQDDSNSLLRKADLALYRAKSDGRARFAIFDPSMEVEAVERLELETDLRRALERDEFRIEYQPIVDLSTDAITAVEALIRWERPGRGIVSPRAFVPIAEDTGLIVPIGQWLLEQACHQARRWQHRNPTIPPLTISVNLSARQFQHLSLVEDIERVLNDCGLPPCSLKLEITESAVMRDAEKAVMTLHALKRLGIQIAIDDFGTGYSSLSYLKQFPVDTLKIDQSFVDGIGSDAQDTAIVQSVVALAKTLNLDITAEGIETEAQRRHLQSLGCDSGQGYLFARPLSEEAIEQLLDQHAHRTPGALRRAA